MISIILPTYNMNGRGVEFVKNNISHILEQDYQNFEIIVSDNSLDCELCESIKGIDKRIKYFKSIKFGSSGNTNFGISKASGDLIKIIFQDDFLYTKDCLSELVNQAKKTDKQWFIYSRIQTGSDDILIPHWNPYILHGINTISAPSVVAFKKQNKVRFKEQLVWYMDICFYYDMFMEYGEPELIKNAVVGISEWDGQVGKSITYEICYRERDYIINNYGII